MSKSKGTGKKRKVMGEDTINNMEENVTFSEIETTICDKGIMRYHRERGPAHYLLQIKSYSALAVTRLERYESDVFEAGDYKWRMIVYLRGHGEANRDRHISMYLKVAETEVEELPVGWEILVHFKLFVHDQINDKYFVIEDVQNRLKRFYSAKTEWGIGDVISMDVFKDPANGYLLNDSCLFGAEVFVAKYSGKRECVSTVLKPPSFGIYTWKLENFSQIKMEFCYSESFTAGGTKWKLKVYPKGNKIGNNGFVSIFLVLDEMEIGKKWFAESTLRVKNQLSTLRNRVAKGGKWFKEWYNYWGLSEFMSVEELKDATKGYCVNDTVIIECQISLIIKTELFED